MRQKASRLQHPVITVAAIATLTLLASADGSAGIQGTGRRLLAVAYGRITAFGSIFVDGIEYDIGKAQILINGKTAQASQLEVGQVVTVQAVESGAAQGSASEVSYTANVVGPISAVNLAASSFTVLGQTIEVDSTTLFGDGIQPTRLAALRPGTSVDVSAFVAASGALVASRIDLQVPSAPLQVEGAVENLDTGAKTFQINSLRIDYSQAVVAGQLTDGMTATVWADEYPAANSLHVTKVQLSAGVGGQNGEEGRVEGLVTSISSAGRFYVGNQLVVTNSTTRFVLHGKTLAPNLPVRVQGHFDATGELVAQTVHTNPN